MTVERRDPGAVPDDEREVPLEDEAEYDVPDPTIDPQERVELGEVLEPEADRFDPEGEL